MDIKQEDIDIFRDKLLKIIDIAEHLYFEDKVSIGKGLLEKLNQGELMLAFIGGTSAGKSTVINNLIQSPILPVSPIPTTGAMTLIRVVNDLSKPTFSKVSLKDGELSVIDDKTFSALSKKDADDFYLIVDMPCDKKLPAGTLFMDVPGYNSLRKRHDSILAQWLPEMDQIVWVINAKTGITESDKVFFDHAKKILNEMPLETISLLVNVHDQKFLRRVDEIQKKFSQFNDGNIPKIFVASLKEKKGRHAILDVEEVQEYLENIFSDEERNTLLLKRIYDLAGLWLKDLKQTAQLIYEQNESDKNKIEERLKHLEEQKNEAFSLLALEEKQWHKITDKTLKELKVKLWEGIDQAIENGSTSSAKETADHVAEFVIRDVIKDNHRQFTKNFEKNYIRICEQLETILMDPISKEWAPDMQGMDYDPGSGVDNQFINQATNKIAYSRISGYLSNMGGRAGGSGVTGIMNFSRKGMGWVNKAGKFVGMEKNIFGRNAMNKVGPFLKRFGLTTARVSEAGAYVAIEAVRYIYTYVTWKPKLRSRYEDILQNSPAPKSGEPRPVYEYHQGIILLFEETFKTLKEEVELIYRERSESLKVQKKYHEQEKINSNWTADYQKLQNFTF